MANPLTSFGLLSDLQYADHDNGRSYYGVVRYYRNAIHCLKEVFFQI